MEKSNKDRDLVCVLFPGVVKNEDKALQCLGGIRGISEAYSYSSKERLGLSFQPNIPYVRKVFADLNKTAGVLFKVKVKKTIAGNEVKREVISTVVVGRVKQIYKFDSLCDFQYLPVATDVRPPTCILEKLFPSGLDTFESFLNTSVPPFILPSAFTRSDKPLSYGYTDKKDDSGSNLEEEDNVHYRIREDRKIPSAQFKFNLTNEMPTEPDQYFDDMLIKADAAVKNDYEIVKKLFEERPIWSRNGIKYNTKTKDAHLKIILPCLAVYIRGGPWKMLWIRYGYDPRKDPGAGKYQCLDFRLRHDGGLNSLVAQRKNPIYLEKVSHVKTLSKEKSLSEDVPEGAVYYRAGMIPPQRQIYYQYCDVDLEEVRALTGEAGEAAGETSEAAGETGETSALCHATRGWLAEGAADACRDHISRHAQLALRAYAVPLSEPTTSTDEDDNSDGQADSTAGNN